MTKTYRQGQIRKLLRTKKIFTQEELAAELKGQGIAATQVTLSRDLRDLKLVKTSAGYRELTQSQEENPPLAGLLSEFLRDARLAQNQVVLKTDPGHASIIAVALDQEDWAEIIGTLAGDDTILVIAADRETAGRLHQRLLDFLS